jgi:hypothetical protein
MKTIVLATLCFLAAVPAFAQGISVVTGFEGGDRAGYAYGSASALIPMGANVDLVPRLTLSYLFFSYDEAAGSVSVTSPGVMAGAGIRVHAPGIAVTVGPAFEVRQTTRRTPFETTTFTQSGPLLFGDLFARPGARTSLSIGGRYSFANDYGVTRAALNYRLTPLEGPQPFVVSLGTETFVQGNPEAYFYGAGALLGLGLPADRTSFQLRFGFMEYVAGDTREGRPYYGIGISRGL